MDYLDHHGYWALRRHYLRDGFPEQLEEMLRSVTIAFPDLAEVAAIPWPGEKSRRRGLLRRFWRMLDWVSGHVWLPLVVTGVLFALPCILFVPSHGQNAGMNWLAGMGAFLVGLFAGVGLLCLAYALEPKLRRI